MHPETDLDEFLQKWRAAWPEWPLAQVFVPETQRASAEAWLALQLEWVEAAWGGEDPTPGFAKLAWWQDELLGWQKGGRRHPLGRVLQRAAAPWGRLSDALETLRAARAPVLDGELDAATAALAPVAVCIAGCEAALFAEAGAEPAGIVPREPLPDAAPGSASDSAPGSASNPASRAAPGAMHPPPAPGLEHAAIRWALIAQHRLWHGAAEGSDAAVRLHRALLAAWPGVRGGNRAGRIHAALVHARLQRQTPGTAPAAPVPPLRTLRVAWRAARG